MTTYRVTWIIDIDADSPEAAAREALDIQLGGHDTCQVFKVKKLSKSSPRIIDLANCERIEDANQKGK